LISENTLFKQAYYQIGNHSETKVTATT